MSESATKHSTETTLQDQHPELRQPPNYRVLLINDDYTPMNFVVHVLETFFNKSQEIATRIMMEVHTRGRSTCGIFSHQIAETKVAQVNSYARENQHPLLCVMERNQEG